MCLFQKCELYWPQPKDKTKTIKEEEEEKDEGETGRFGRFLLRVTDSQEKDGFTVTDMEIQVNHWFPSDECRLVVTRCLIFNRNVT